MTFKGKVRIISATMCVLALTAPVLFAADTVDEELAIKQLDRQNHAVSRVLAPTASVNYSGDTTGGLTWARPYDLGDGTSGSCSISGAGTAVAYNVQEFHVDTTGLYTMDGTWTGFDGYLHLYETAFDPLDQCVNLIALDDDGPGGAGDSQILDVTLTSGVQYILIADGYGNSDYGPYDITISGVGQPILGTVPVELMSFSVQ
jgi:hypothetical protein